MLKIGEKIKKLRIANDLTQEELASRAGLTKGYISQLERDLTYPSIVTLKDILDVLGTDLATFFKEESAERVVFRQEDRQKIEGSGIEFLIPGSGQKIMEPVLVTLKPGEKTTPDAPHEGEEFGFILKGVVKLWIGAQAEKLRKGECFYFRADKRHFVENVGRSMAQILWVVSPPTF
ncbi:cupin domain-containing protein [Thermodesulfatator autotrophicus]|uniref:Cro/Cl family transcriptional regulator n=1 Tax=Thermodesulfatator autotrophicus TaxID=1795632 RepID=A0A177EA02_9BACT|nr:cupin domain-containing protein [Thermodesulfatator autotrophicus]OAG28628.1 Cro/Cl family transcriptional regulator [Thermodesulfatator autotrophicus]